MFKLLVLAELDIAWAKQMTITFAWAIQLVRLRPEQRPNQSFCVCGVKVLQSTTTDYACMKIQRIANSWNTLPKGTYRHEKLKKHKCRLVYFIFLKCVVVVVFNTGNCHQNCVNRAAWFMWIWKIIVTKTSSNSPVEWNHSPAKDIRLAGNTPHQKQFFPKTNFLWYSNNKKLFLFPVAT